MATTKTAGVSKVEAGRTRRNREKVTDDRQLPLPAPKPKAKRGPRDEAYWAARIDALAEYWEGLCEVDKAERYEQYAKMERVAGAGKPPKAESPLDENGLPKVVTFSWLMNELERLKEKVPEEELEVYVVKAIAWALRRKFNLPKARYQRNHLHDTISECGMAATVEAVRSLFVKSDGVANVWAVIRFRAKGFAGLDT